MILLPAVLRADTTFDSGTTTISTGTEFGVNLYVGHSGTATMQVITGGSAASMYSYLGYNAGSVGTATVSDGLWASSDALVVGYFGTGNLNVGGGSVSSGYLDIGLNGPGALSLAGGRVASGTGLVGGSVGVVGTATVSSGSWASSFLTVGYEGLGVVNLGGGTVVTDACILGAGTASLGTVAVSGGTWSNNGEISLGTMGRGALLVSAGRVVSGSHVFLGAGVDASGTATVTGGTLATAATLYIGYSGTGTLRIDGGRVSTQGGAVGFAPWSVGLATVTGGTWANDGDLEVGTTGTGTLTMSGGLVTVGGTLTRGSTGTINLLAGGTLQIGTGGTTGWLDVSTLVDDGTLIVDRSTASTFAGTVSGSGRIVKRGGGTLGLSGSNTITGSTTIQQGTLRLAHAAALVGSQISPVAGGTLTLTPALRTTVGGLDPRVGGLVDVGNGSVTVASGLSTTDLVAAIVAGRGDGSWSGTSGITSSVAAHDVSLTLIRAVGWLDEGFGSLTFAYAAPGDTNLDWVVDVLDAANLAASGKYNSGLAATWFEGDFNYDDVVDILDVSDFIAAGLYNGGPYNSMESLAPEPGMLGIMGMVGIGVAGRVVTGRTRRLPSTRDRRARA